MGRPRCSSQVALEEGGEGDAADVAVVLPAARHVLGDTPPGHRLDGHTVELSAGNATPHKTKSAA